jgi:internalin A
MPHGARLSLIDGAELDGVTELPAEVRLVQFRQRLTADRFRHLSSLLDGRPEIGLRAYLGSDITDLEFLGFFAGLRSFQVDGIWQGLTSIDGLRHVRPTLESLGIGRTRRPLSLAVLGQLGALRSLAVEGQHHDLAVLADLHSLETLTLRSITLPDLGLLTGLDRLRSLALKLGGTNDLALLPGVGRLEEFEIWHVRGLADLTPIGSVTSLKRLFLQAQPQVRALPDLSRLTELSDVTLHTMKGITDVSPVASAPTLAKLNLVVMPHLPPESLRPLVGHPTLRRGLWNREHAEDVPGPRHLAGRSRALRIRGLAGRGALSDDREGLAGSGPGRHA